MTINFNDIKEITISEMNNGSGQMLAKMFIDEGVKIIPCRIYVGGLIGLHSHPTSDDINYIVSGKGKAICDGVEEQLLPGHCHIYKKDSNHSIINVGDEDLVLITIVVEK